MKQITFNVKLFLKTTVFAVLSLLMVAYVQAQVWNAPTGNPPGGNTPTPINVGTSAQVKDGTLGVNGLGVFGNSILNAGPASVTYLNFGEVSGEGGYGVRDNNGVIECKNEAGDWGECGSGLSGGENTGSMIPGFPDAIACTNLPETAYFFIEYHLNDGGVSYSPTFGEDDGTGRYQVTFNADGSYRSSSGPVGECLNETISNLYSTGKAFNFTGGDSFLSYNGGACTFAGKKPSGWPDAMMCSDTTGHSYTMLYGGEQNTPGIHNYVSVHGTGYVRFDSSGNYIDQLSFGGYDCVGKSITQIQTEGIGFAMCGGGDSGSSLNSDQLQGVITCSASFKFYIPGDPSADENGCVTAPYAGTSDPTYADCPAGGSLLSGGVNPPPGVHGEVYNGSCYGSYDGSYTVQCMNGTWQEVSSSCQGGD